MNRLMSVLGKRYDAKVNIHFYHLPMLRIAGCYTLLTLDTPCTVCGSPCSGKMHKVVGHI